LAINSDAFWAAKGVERFAPLKPTVPELIIIFLLFGPVACNIVLLDVYFIAKLTNNFFYIPQILGYYFQHDQNLSKKDMSIPYKNAVSEFKELLTKKENTRVKANIKYISGKFYYQINYYEKSKKDLNYVLKYGHIYLKLRTLLMLLMMLLK
jgi:hypothetical protein